MKQFFYSIKEKVITTNKIDIGVLILFSIVTLMFLLSFVKFYFQKFISGIIAGLIDCNWGSKSLKYCKYFSYMNLINISLKVKNQDGLVNIILYQKIYSTPDGIINHWSTNQGSEYRLEVIIDEQDVSVNPSKITKDLDIITDVWEIADQMMLKLYEKKIFQMQNV